MLVIGLISGTSADGVDAALVEIVEDKAPDTRLAVDLRAWLTVPYPDILRETILRIATGAPTSAGEICQASFAIGGAFADAALRLCAEAGVAPGDVQLVGSHGQTVWHDPVAGRPALWPGGSTLQLGQAALIAERTGITTVSDFRPRDMAAGGQGAPLVPMVDYLLFRDAAEGRLLLNLGGIANVTVLPAGCGPQDVLGFDTGPGNMLIDGAVLALSDGAQRYDRGGAWALAGAVQAGLLDELLSEPYYNEPPPKSTGRELFGRSYTERLIERGRRSGMSDADIVATVTELTAATVAAAVDGFVLRGATRGGFGTVVASGGGTHNQALMGALARRLAPMGIRLCESEAVCGIASDAREAVAFAVLAWLTWQCRAGNVPSVTGARRPVVLGSITPGSGPRQR